MLPQNAITIEIAPHGLLRSILKRSLKDGTQISLTQKDCKDGVSFFIDALGR
jgi:fatty acid synthase